jgi:hypothetical protein
MTHYECKILIIILTVVIYKNAYVFSHLRISDWKSYVVWGEYWSEAYADKRIFCYHNLAIHPSLMTMLIGQAVYSLTGIGSGGITEPPASPHQHK